MGSNLISSATLTKAVPVFVAIMFWLIRVLIINTFPVVGERFFSMGTRPSLRLQHGNTSIITPLFTSDQLFIIPPVNCYASSKAQALRSNSRNACSRYVVIAMR